MLNEFNKSTVLDDHLMIISNGSILEKHQNRH